MKGSTLATVLPPLAALLALIALWQVSTVVFAIPDYILPSPLGIADAVAANWQLLLKQSWATFVESMLGFGLGIVVGIPLAVLIACSPTVEKTFYPLLVASQSVPKVALAPIFVVWFGFGLLPKVLLVILVTFFPILVSLLSGYRAAPQAYVDLLASMGAGRGRIFRRVMLPSARPAFFAGLRISATYAIVATIFAEYAGARSGIGIYILAAKNNFRADLVLSGVVASALLTLALLALLGTLEHLTGRRFRGGRDAVH